MVRLLFRLFLEGDGASGPMGVKAVATWLNDSGYRTRRGARWGIGPLDAILTRPTYKGVHQFNRKGGMTLRTGKSGRYRQVGLQGPFHFDGQAGCSISMDRLDTPVTERLADQLLTPERL